MIVRVSFSFLPKDGEQLHIRVQIMLQTRGSGGMENFGGIWHANAPHPLPSSLKDTLILQVTSLILSLSHAGRDYLCWI